MMDAVVLAAVTETMAVVDAKTVAAVMETPIIIPFLEALGGYSYQYYYLFVLVEMALEAVETDVVVVQQMVVDVAVVILDAKMRKLSIIS